MNLKPKMFLLVIGSLIVALTALSVPIYWYTRSALEEELDKRLLGMLELSAQLLDADMLGVLSEEPALGQVRLEVERTLQRSVIQDIAGMAVFSSRHTILASTDPPPVEEGLLFSTIDLALQASDSHSVVSNLYRAKEGGYLKTAARSIPTTGSRPVVLVVYGNAASMEYIDQLAGTIFWVVAITLVLAVALTLTFSQSLIRPVQQLSQYAKAIQRDLHTAPVRLQRSDELGDLSQALAEMHAEIKENEAYSRQMLSGIAHEIKNPLGGMEIYTGLLEEELESNSPHREYLKKIKESLHTLNQTVISYLDYARPPRSSLRVLSVGAIVADVHRLLLPELRHRNIRFSGKGDAEVVADESKLRRVILNLLQNSLDAVPPNTGEISVEVRSNSEHLSIEISDNGLGIPSQDLDHIFEPYYTTREKGYGMGLAIAKDIVEEFNGAIVVHSEEGKGSAFKITFPKEK